MTEPKDVIYRGYVIKKHILGGWLIGKLYFGCLGEAYKYVEWMRDCLRAAVWSLERDRS